MKNNTIINKDKEINKSFDFKNIKNIFNKKIWIAFSILFTLIVTVILIIFFSRSSKTLVREIEYDITVNVYELDTINNEAIMLETKEESSVYIYISDFFENSIMWNVNIDNSGVLTRINSKEDETKGIKSSNNTFIQLGSPTSKKQCSNTIINPKIKNPNSKYCSYGFAPGGIINEFKINNDNEVLDLYLTDWTK